MQNILGRRRHWGIVHHLFASIDGNSSDEEYLAIAQTLCELGIYQAFDLFRRKIETRGLNAKLLSLARWKILTRSVRLRDQIDSDSLSDLDDFGINEDDSWLYVAANLLCESEDARAHTFWARIQARMFGNNGVDADWDWSRHTTLGVAGSSEPFRTGLSTIPCQGRGRRGVLYRGVCRGQ